MFVRVKSFVFMTPGRVMKSESSLIKRILIGPLGIVAAVGGINRLFPRNLWPYNNNSRETLSEDQWTLRSTDAVPINLANRSLEETAFCLEG